MTIDVYMKLTTGRVFHIPVPEHETIRELCEKVAVEEGVPSNCLRLKYTGKVLNKDHSISYLGVRQETILKADVIHPKSLTVHVKCLSGDMIPLTIQNVTALKEIMSRVNDKQEILGQANSNVNTRLHMKGKPFLGDNNLAQDLGIEDETVLELVEQAAAAASGYEEQVVEEDLDQAALDELMATFAGGFDRDKAVEVVFSFDTTGSMHGSLLEVRSKLDETVTRLLRDIPKIRIGIMSHGDYCDQFRLYVLRSIDLTSKLKKLRKYINNVPASGGCGDSACYEWVMRKAQDLSWSKDATKALVIIGDVRPNEASYTNLRINWHEELEKLCQREIKVYGVQVRGGPYYMPFYKRLATRSGGAYINFKHFNYLTDMFLAVCYREAGEAQLEQFAEEVAQDGRMTEELTDMFQQLKDEPSTAEEEPKEDEKKEEVETRNAWEFEYARHAWWNPESDTCAQPQFTYNHITKLWTSNWQLRSYGSERRPCCAIM